MVLVATNFGTKALHAPARANSTNTKLTVPTDIKVLKLEYVTKEKVQVSRRNP